MTLTTTEQQRIERAMELKQRRINEAMDRKELGMSVGAALNKATDLVIAILNHPNIYKIPQSNPELEELIREWTDRLYKISRDKKDFESLPIIEDLKPLSDKTKWQEDYDHESELQETAEQIINLEQ